MPRRKTSQKSPKKTPKTIAYEVKGPQGTRQVQASSTAELKAALLPLLPLRVDSAHGLAALLFNENVSVTHKRWGVKRLGIVTIVAEDEDDAAQPRKAKQQQPQQEATEPEQTQAPQAAPVLPVLPVLAEEAQPTLVSREAAAPIPPQVDTPPQEQGQPAVE